MRDRVVLILIVILGVAFSGSPSAAGGPRTELPSRFVAALDGAPAIVDLPAEGLRLSAWPYRSGAEYDLALSVQDASGVWSRPSFFGAGDGVDQIEPALAVDSNGTVYLAFAVRPQGSIWLAVRAKGGAWSPSIAVTPAEARASTPAMAIVGDRLVLAYRTGPRTVIVDLPLLSPTTSPFGVQDGPDGVDPLGVLPAPIGSN